MSAFIDSIVLARQGAADDAGALAECATALQQHNRDLKQYIAKLDAEAVKEATAGWGRVQRQASQPRRLGIRRPSRPTTARYTAAAARPARDQCGRP